MEELVQDEKRECGERCQIGDGGGKGGRRVKNPLKIFLNANLFCPFRFRHRFIFSVTGDAGPAVSCSCGKDQLYYESHSLNEAFVIKMALL